ncbi:MAG: acyl-CoA synthetase [SAR86 cluster bacterium]|uniref:Acyl-CoA synthetase n=1 Tax=SAR86 cluster bacterium TaxID=2030880 RepID=A0A520MWL9_9GAMM|nr:MAG: acyl-CoA synthetase [Gammaproteobacteria bacterium TMED225]RZO25613.1 MAG: acyl-CoA synthetase [SAR86 cluster bacterium]|tara:strand:- start:1387 stop:3003 length:1617 start_codon:yes stop_codon:yes gene_type:complete
MNLDFASVWEMISDIIPDNQALICEDEVILWKDYDIQSSKIATALSNAGLSANSKAGLYLNNSNEYLIGQNAIFKIGGVPINVNYRYVAEELIYLLDNSDSEAVFYHACYSSRIKEIADSLPNIKVWIEVADGSESHYKDALKFEELLESCDPMERIHRDPNTIYMLYTGGTTGMPKGVMYKQGEFLVYLFRTLKAMGYDVPEDINDLEQQIYDFKEENSFIKSLVGCPLMHGTGMWLGAFLPLLLGGTAITSKNLGFDADQIWKQVEDTQTTNIVIVGDAFARPMLDALDRAVESGKPYDLSSVNVIISSGVMWSEEVKNGLLKHHNMMLMDTMGSTEGGMGSSVSNRDNPPKTAKFSLNPGVIILADDGEILEPGSDKIGMIGTSGLVPVGYFKDKAKSDKTFKEVDGVRYSFPGDYAKLEKDGSITLLGRGSNCINSAGEKIYPEEVEEAIKRNKEVFDCLVVGVDDQKFGQKVIAVVSMESDTHITQDLLVDSTRAFLAGYKLPKKIIFVDEVKRAPNGKANYKWAKEIANESL